MLFLLLCFSASDPVNGSKKYETNSTMTDIPITIKPDEKRKTFIDILNENASTTPPRTIPLPPTPAPTWCEPSITDKVKKKPKTKVIVGGAAANALVGEAFFI